MGLIEVLPQAMNHRPPAYRGRNPLESLLASDDPQVRRRGGRGGGRGGGGGREWIGFERRKWWGDRHARTPTASPPPTAIVPASCHLHLPASCQSQLAQLAAVVLQSFPLRYSGFALVDRRPKAHLANRYLVMPGIPPPPAHTRSHNPTGLAAHQ